MMEKLESCPQCGTGALGWSGWIYDRQHCQACGHSYQAANLEAALNNMRARKDAAYLERNRLVAVLAATYPSGLKRTAIEGWDPEWHNVVYIDLPSGQASWHYHDSHAFLFAHLPPYEGDWDGHSTEEKYERVSRLTREL